MKRHTHTQEKKSRRKIIIIIIGVDRDDCGCVDTTTATDTQVMLFTIVTEKRVTINNNNMLTRVLHYDVREDTPFRKTAGADLGIRIYFSFFWVGAL